MFFKNNVDFFVVRKYDDGDLYYCVRCVFFSYCDNIGILFIWYEREKIIIKIM